MAGTKVQIKRSSVAGRVPTAADIDVGQLAVNFTDKRFFTKDGSNTVIDVHGQSLNTTANVTFRDGAFANITATTFAGNLDWTYITSKPDLKINITGDATGNTTFTDLANGSINVTLANTTVTAGTYGNSSVIPVITVDSKGRITSATTNAVAGITGFSYESSNNTFAITAGDGSVYKTTLSSVNVFSVGSLLDVSGNGYFAGDVSIVGDLTVQGNVSFINTTTLNIGDNFIVLNANTTGTPTLNAGIEVARGTSANAILQWDELTDRWSVVNDGVNIEVIATNNDISSAVSNLITTISNASGNAYSNAVAYADTKAATAYSNAVSTAAADATTKADTAYSNAVSTAATDASTKAATAYSNAVSTAAADATTKAANAYATAVAVAATDASAKAGVAFSNATMYSATDASTKAATAYSNAVSTAAADATTKADAAYSNAVAYAASNTYVNDTFAKLSGATFTGAVAVGNTFASGNTTVTGYVNTNIGFYVYGTSSRVLTANAGGIWPNSNTAGLNLGDPDKRWWYVGANTGSFSGTLEVSGVLSAMGDVGTRVVSSHSISSDADLALRPGSVAANGVVVQGWRGGQWSQNLKIDNNGVATFANTIIATNILVGNSTVNATINSTAFALNGVPIGGTGPADAAYTNAVAQATTLAATAYSNAATYADAAATSAYNNAVSYADTKAATAYSNAVSTAYAMASGYAADKAANAYSNAIAYAASNTYVNATFAPLANPSFTGTVTVQTVSANGTTGQSGQVLTTNGSNVYWSNVATSGFTNGQSISVANLAITGSVTANGSTGTAGQVLTTDGTAAYWSTVTSGGNSFGTIAVSGQSDLVADQILDTLTLIAGNNIVLATNANNDSITISSTASGGGIGNSAGNAFISGRDNFVGDGTTTAFTLSQTATANSILVLAEGLVQFYNEDYDVSGTTLTFAAAPANNEHIEVVFISGASTYHFMQYGAIDSFTGDGTTTDFTLTRVANTSSATVHLDGLLQTPTTDFTFSNTTLSFTTAPLSGEIVLVYHTDSIASVLPGASIASTDTFVGDGTTTTFAISGSANSTTAMVTVNGLLQGYTAEYTTTGSALTFVDAPPNGSAIQVIRLAGSVGSAFTSVRVGSSTVSADSPSTGMSLANTAGITLSASSSNNTITIGVPDIAKQSLTGNGSNTQFTLTYAASADDLFVYVNGIYFHPDEDYTVSNTTITFTDAPVDQSQIRIRFMRAPSGLISYMGDLLSGDGSYDMNSQDGPPVDLNA